MTTSTWLTHTPRQHPSHSREMTFKGTSVGTCPLGARTPEVVKCCDIVSLDCRKQIEFPRCIQVGSRGFHIENDLYLTSTLQKTTVDFSIASTTLTFRVAKNSQGGKKQRYNRVHTRIAHKCCRANYFGTSPV